MADMGTRTGRRRKKERREREESGSSDGKKSEMKATRVPIFSGRTVTSVESPSEV